MLSMLLAILPENWLVLAGLFRWLLIWPNRYTCSTRKTTSEYTFSNGQFVQTGTPALTKNFAGIGTREITKAGEQAIREVYEKTISELGKAPAPVAEQQAAPAPVRS